MTQPKGSAPLVSVIVPVYGVEAYFPACLASLFAQTFTDFELILVDDGSPDGCGALCDAAAAQDPRVRAIHRPNGGLSAARNSGLAIARGAYIAFVDSDDLVHPDYLEQLYASCAETGADMALCAVQDVSEQGEPLLPPALTRPDGPGVFPGKELLSHFFGPGSTCYTVAWNKLYKAELWRTLRYPEGMLHEDDAVAHLLFWSAKTVACVDKPLYFYRLRQGSICRTELRPAHFDGVSAHAAWCRFFAEKELGAPLVRQALAGCWRRYLALCAQALAAPLTWPLAARWHTVQAEMRQLLPLLRRFGGLSLPETLSARRWALRALPLPPKTEQPRVALLLPPGLPVPAVQGGAVETLAQHLARQNQISQGLELAVICQWDAAAAAQAAALSHTLFFYQAPPQRNLFHSLCSRLSGLCGRPIHWNRWYAAPLPFLKRLAADFYIGEGGDLTGWQQASRALGREKFVAHLHGVTPGGPVLDSIYSKAIAISEHVRGAWLSASRSSPESAALVPNCVDTGLFRPLPPAEAQAERRALRADLGLAGTDFVLLFCGRTCPEKGVHQLIAALGRIPDPSVKLLVVGSPFFGAQAASPFLEQLGRQAAALGGRVQFTGFVPNDRLPAYYRMADAACFPALWEEPAGITAIEAMACGCPVIATRSGGMPEYLSGSGAILVDRSEIYKEGQLLPQPGVPPLAQTLAQAILDLQADPTRRARMSRAGIAAAARFSAGQYYQNTLAALTGWKKG